MLGGLLGPTTGWLALSPEEMVRLRDSAERADEDTSQVVRVGTVLSGQVPERFSVLTSTLARTEEVPAASMWLLGTKASLTSTFVAIYPRGGAALVFECAFELYSLPPVELAAVEGRAPAEVWMGYANGTEADLLARLDAAAQAAEPVLLRADAPAPEAAAAGVWRRPGRGRGGFASRRGDRRRHGRGGWAAPG